MSPVEWLFFGLLALIFLSQLMALIGLVRRKTTTDRGSAWALVGAWYLVLAVSALEAWLWPAPGLTWTRWLGAALFLVGMVLRIVAVQTLDEQFSPLVELQAEHQLITHGIYRRVRHPAYLGSLMWTLAVPLILTSAFGLACAVAVYLPALRYRIAVEERLLEAHFGEAYARYRQAVPALWPRLSRPGG